MSYFSRGKFYTLYPEELGQSTWPEECEGKKVVKGRVQGTPYGSCTEWETKTKREALNLTKEWEEAHK